MKRTIKIGKYEFDGPLHFSVNLEPTSGVFAALCESDEKLTVLDIGQAETVRYFVKEYEHVSCWNKHCAGFVKLAAYYCNEEDRIRIAAELRAELDPPCGK